MENYVQVDDGISVVAPYARSSGEGVLVGALFGVCIDTIASGATGVIARKGVFTLPKTGGTGGSALAAGAIVYWDDSAKNISATSTGNTKAGYAAEAVGTGATSVKVLIHQ